MHGLSLTYHTLTNSRNQAALDVLLAVIESENPSLVTKAVTALVQTEHFNDDDHAGSNAPQKLLEHWAKLREKEKAILRKASPWMDASVLATLQNGSGPVDLAIQAARDLQLVTAIEPMVSLAESSGSEDTRKAAAEAVLEMVVPLGNAANDDRKSKSVRNSVLSCLAKSVEQFSTHHNEMLVEAFLYVTTGNDGDIQRMIDDGGPAFELICNQFENSKHPAVIELLASYVRRRKPDDRIMNLMGNRIDEAFTDALMDSIGSMPSAHTLENLKGLGIPSSCKSGVDLMPTLDPERRAALVSLHVAANPDTIKVMQTIVAAIQLGGDGCETVAAKGLSSCEVLDIEFWMRAAATVAEDDAEEIACDENAQLLHDLIDLLDHRDARIVDGVRHVLSPMHAAAMLPRMARLRARSRRRLGRVVMMIDPDAIDRVHDALRHPVLERRLEAITMANSLALVDLLADSFSHISSKDHQRARICAAEAMGEASGDETLQLLESMVRMPVSPVRDAAASALERRQNMQAKKSGNRSARSQQNSSKSGDR